jgi:hypothetical protein
MAVDAGGCRGLAFGGLYGATDVSIRGVESAAMSSWHPDASCAADARESRAPKTAMSSCPLRSNPSSGVFSQSVHLSRATNREMCAPEQGNQ